MSKLGENRLLPVKEKTLGDPMTKKSVSLTVSISLRNRELSIMIKINYKQDLYLPSLSG
jgi:hypothetical protein